MKYLEICLSKILLKLKPKAFLKDLLEKANEVIEEAENSGNPEEIIISFMSPYLIVLASLKVIEEDTPKNIELLDKVYEKWSKEKE